MKWVRTSHGDIDITRSSYLVTRAKQALTPTHEKADDRRIWLAQRCVYWVTVLAWKREAAGMGVEFIRKNRRASQNA